MSGLPSSPPGFARFGPFELNLQTGELRKSGVRVRLQEQPFRVLTALLERPGELVAREELHQRLWPDADFGDFEQGLNKAVNKLRTALSDKAENPRYVETLARRGYRFVAPAQVSPLPETTSLAKVLNAEEKSLGPEPGEHPVPSPLVALRESRSPVDTPRKIPAVPPPANGPWHHLTRGVSTLLKVVGALVLVFAIWLVLPFGTPKYSLPAQLTGSEAEGVAQRWIPTQNQWVSLDPPVSADCIRYSADGEWMTFVAYPSAQLWVTRSDGSDPLELAPGQFERTYTPSWSPDGEWLAFAGRKWDSPWKAYLIRRDGDGLRELNPGPGTEADPTWSPDGKKLALAPFPWDTTESGTGIFVVDIASQAIRLLEESRGLFSPRWSPDGTHIAALTAERSQLALYNLADRSWRPVSGDGASHPIWDSNSSAVYFVSLDNGRQIKRYVLAAAKEEALLPLRNIRTLSNSPFGPNADAWVGLTVRNEPIILRAKSE